MLEDESYRTTLAKASLLIGHFRVDFIAVDEAVLQRFERYGKIRAELGI